MILIRMNFGSQVFHLIIGSSNVGKKMICNLVLLFVLHLLICNSSYTLPVVMLIKVLRVNLFLTCDELFPILLLPASSVGSGIEYG